MSFTVDKQTLDDLNLLGKYRSNSIYIVFSRTHTQGGEMVLEQMFRNPLSVADAINSWGFSRLGGNYGNCIIVEPIPECDNSTFYCFVLCICSFLYECIKRLFFSIATIHAKSDMVVYRVRDGVGANEWCE